MASRASNNQKHKILHLFRRRSYETVSYTHLAHRELEYLCTDKKTQAFNEVASNKFTELVYSGEWYTPLREALSAYFDKVNETVTGTVKLKLYKGNIIPAGSTSPVSYTHLDVYKRQISGSESLQIG